MYQFVESIKFLNGKFYNLEFHQQRMEYTRKVFFENCKPLNLYHILVNPVNYLQDVLYKYRVIYNDQIEAIESEVYQPKIFKRFYLVICPDDFAYNFKTTDRTFFDNARKKLKPEEDFLYVRKGKITDSSFANLVFSDGTNLVTPADTLLKGTRRACYLREGIIRENEIRVKDLDKFTCFYTINAMLGLEDSSPHGLNEILLSNYTLKL